MEDQHEEESTSPFPLIKASDSRRATIGLRGTSRRSTESPWVSISSCESSTSVAAEQECNGKWLQIHHKSGVCMSGHTACIIGQRMVVFGGYNDSSALNSMAILDLDNLTWKSELQMAGDPPSARTSHSVVVDTSKHSMYVLFGSGSQFGRSNLADVHRFDLRLQTWTQVQYNGERPAPRYGQSAVMHSTNSVRRIVIFGGTFGRDFSNELWSLDLADFRMSRIHCTGDIPSARYKHSMAVLPFNSDKAIMFGGAERLNYQLNDCYLLDMPTGRWTLLECSGDIPVGRFAHIAVMTNTHMIIHGGTDRVSCFEDLYMLELSTLSWSKFDHLTPVPSGRYFHTGVMHCDEHSGLFRLIILAGKGSVQQQLRYSDCFCINIAKGPSAFSRDSLSRDLVRLFDQGKLCDLELICTDGVVIMGHSVILNARCPQLFTGFQRVLVTEDGPSLLPEPRLSLLDIEDCVGTLQLPCDSILAEILVYFIYSDELFVSPGVQLEHYLSILILISHHNLDLLRLAALCEDRIKSDISPSEAVACLDSISAQAASLPDLEQFLLLYSSLHFGQRSSLGGSLDTSSLNLLRNRENILPGPTLHRDLLRLRYHCLRGRKTDRDSTTPYDVSFSFDDNVELGAHSVILAARSEYFGSFSFCRGMSESHTGVCDLSPRERSETNPELSGVISAPAFSVLLDYIYGGTFALSGDSLTKGIAKEIVRGDICNYFGLSTRHMEKHCLRFLHNHADDVSPQANNCSIM